jgi:small subunit ribosomal protein S21
MLIIPVKEGENIDRALKRFKRKFDKTGTMRQLRSRQQFVKKSVRKREQLQKAQYIQAHALAATETLKLQNYKTSRIPFLALFQKLHLPISSKR